MDPDTTRRVLRAARTLLQWDQARFAKALGTSVATMKRYEAGYPVADKTVQGMMQCLAGSGVIVIEGMSIGGQAAVATVSLLETAEVGEAPFMRKDAAPDEKVRKKGPRRPAEQVAALVEARRPKRPPSPVKGARSRNSPKP